jgi:hypothetical protein
LCRSDGCQNRRANHSSYSTSHAFASKNALL